LIIRVLCADELVTGGVELHPATKPALRSKNCRRFKSISQFFENVSVFKHQTDHHTVMHFGAGVVIQREHESDTQARLHSADGF
jgi:hypothetical protein